MQKLNPTYQKMAQDKPRGHRIANLEKELKTLDGFEDGIKNRMQDRLKFMSAKNARSNQLTLDHIDRRRMLIKTELNSLQDII